MGKLGLLLALGALGLAGWVAYGQCERDQQILQLTEGNQDLQDAMNDLETKLDTWIEETLTNHWRRYGIFK